ncbi:MAG: hypothetical protein DMG08_20825, partial [Acidobacteria bacterium]
MLELALGSRIRGCAISGWACCVTCCEERIGACAYSRWHDGAIGKRPDARHLDDPLTKFFPDLPAFGRDIKVRHLLNHTSGLPAYEDLMPEGAQPIVDADVLASLQTIFGLV